MTTDVEDRIRRALTDLAATTTTSPDARERIAQRARPRGSRVRVALLAAAGLAVIVAGLVFVAVVVRGPASTDNEVRGPATSTTPAPGSTLPDGTTTWTFTGEDGGIEWTLEARRFPGGPLTVDARTDAGSFRWEDPPTDRVVAAFSTGGNRPVRLVAGTTPASAATARVTLADGTVLPIDVLGDGAAIGARFFVTTLPADATTGAVVEAFATDGTPLGQFSL
jgi:hypothetical protein